MPRYFRDAAQTVQTASIDEATGNFSGANLVLKGDLVLNVEDFRASTDGSDTACIQAALTAAAAADGAVIYLPKKLYTVNQTLVLRRRFRLVGGGTWTVLKLANGSNVDLINTLNFGTLTGGGTQAGPDDFAIENITLDGNGQNQTGTSWTLRVYGSNYKVRGAHIRNGYSGNVWSEWGTGGTNMEANWSDFRVYNSIAGSNVVWNGPHDSSFANGFIFRDGTVTDGIGDGFITQNTAGGEILTNVHVWGNHLNGITFNKFGEATNCVSEGALGINVLLNAIRSLWHGTVYGRATGAGANEVGIQVGTSAGPAMNGYVIQGNVWQWTAATSIPINYVKDDGGVTMVSVYKSAAPEVRGGTLSTKSVAMLHCPDDNSKSLFFSPRLVMNTPNGSVLQITNGVKDMLRFVSNSTDGLMQLPNNTAFRFYSNAYTTETARIDGSNGVVTGSGGFVGPGRIVTAPTTLLNTDGTIEFQITSAQNQALPAVAGITAWKTFEFINTSAFNLTITTATNGVTNRVIAPGGAVQLKHNGTAWLAS